MSATKASSRLRAARKRLAASTQRPGRRRAKRARPPASLVPLRCFVLAVDTAARSGWACMAGQDEYLAFGEADTLDREALGYIVRWAVCNAAARRLPLVLVLEAPFGGRLTTVMALGAARERWLCAWREAGQSNRQVVSVQPSEWRARVLGRRWARAPRAEVRAQEQAVAAATVSERVRADEAAAILIARWAMRAAKVAAVLPPSAARAAPAKFSIARAIEQGRQRATMTECMCEFPATCDGECVLRCCGCGGDLCVCAACYGHGERDCDGCRDCRHLDDDGFETSGEDAHDD